MFLAFYLFVCLGMMIHGIIIYFLRERETWGDIKFDLYSGGKELEEFGNGENLIKIYCKKAFSINNIKSKTGSVMTMKDYRNF